MKRRKLWLAIALVFAFPLNVAPAASDDGPATPEARKQLELLLRDIKRAGEDGKRRSSPSRVLPFVNAPCASITARLPANSKQWSQIDRLTDRIIRAKDARQARQAYEEMFHDCQAELIGKLKTGPFEGVALRAAWEEASRDFPGGKDGLAKARPADSKKLQNFLGFAERRLGVGLPDWWKQTARTGTGYRRDNIYFKESQAYRLGEKDLYLAPDVTLQHQGQEMVLEADGKTIGIPDPVLSKICEDHYYRLLSVTVDSDKGYLALHSDRGSPYLLHSVEKLSGRIAWSSKVWAAGGLVVYEGQGYHRASITVQKGRLYVFGASDDAVYIEAFCDKDGCNLFRFSTAY